MSKSVFALAMVLASLAVLAPGVHSQASPAAGSGYFEAAQPPIGEGQALIKLVFSLPAGEVAPDAGFRFSLNLDTYLTKNQWKSSGLSLVLPTGVHTYIAYLPVPTAGDAVACSLRYSAHRTQEYVNGYLGKSGTSFRDENYRFPVKPGEVREVRFSARKGVTLNGTVTIPVPEAGPTVNDQYCMIRFTALDSAGDGFSGYRLMAYKGAGVPMPFSIGLPANAKFVVTVSNIYGGSANGLDCGTLTTGAVGSAPQAYSVTLKEAQLVSFADAAFEHVVRAKLNKPTEPLYDYMLGVIRDFDLDGTTISTVSDLAKFPRIDNLVIRNFPELDDEVDVLSGLGHLIVLTITGSPLEDLSFLSGCPAISYLDIRDNGTLEDLSMIDSLDRLVDLRVEKPSFKADLTPLLTKSTRIKVATEYGVGESAVRKSMAVNQKVQEILASVIKPDMSDVEIEFAIHGYLIANVKFDRKIGVGEGLVTPTTPYAGLVDGLANSSGFAELFKMLLSLVDIESRIVRGKVVDDPPFPINWDHAHVWNMVNLDGEFYHVDVTWNAANAMAPYRYFNATDAMIGADHTWTVGDYPACTASTYVYSKYRKMMADKNPTSNEQNKPAIAGPSEFKPMTMVPVPAGSFVFSNGLQKISLSSFSISATECTQAQFQAVMGRNPSIFNREPDAPQRPVDSVSWYDAVEFCNALSQREGLRPYYSIDKLTVTINQGSDGYRLPTEAEWEYVAREAGKVDDNIAISNLHENEIPRAASQQTAAWFDVRLGNNRTVGAGKPNNLGVYDIMSNVIEWCWDWASFEPKASKDPTGETTGGKRVLGTLTTKSYYPKTTILLPYGENPGKRLYNAGFRVARSVPAQQ